MKRFNFKLDNVLKYRVTMEKTAKNVYKEALRVLNTHKDFLLELENARKELMQAYNIKAGTVVHPETLAFIARYTSQLIQLTERQKKIIAQNEDIVKEKFDLWNLKRKDVKVIERLKEKKWQEYLREADKADQKFQDEIFIAKKIREREAAP